MSSVNELGYETFTVESIKSPGLRAAEAKQSTTDSPAETAKAAEAKRLADEETAKAKEAEIAARKAADAKRDQDAKDQLSLIEMFWRESQSRQAKDFIQLGQYCAEYVNICLAGVEKGRKQVRSLAVKAVSLKLELISGEQLDVNRAIGTYHLCKLLGPSAETLAVGALKGLLPLIQREEATEQWFIVPKYDATLRDIYDRLSNGKMTGRDVRVEVQQALGRVSTEATKSKTETTTVASTTKANAKADDSNGKASEKSKPSAEAYIIPQGKDAAAAISKIVEHTGERGLTFKLLGQIIQVGDMQQLIAGLAESVKADKKRRKVWIALVDAMQKQRDAIKTDEQPSQEGKKPATMAA